MTPVTRYAKSRDVRIACQVFGGGPLDLVLAPLFLSNIEVLWEHPDIARWLLRLASYARVAMFDKRRTGMSDRVGELPGLDQRIDDLRAVMDAFAARVRLPRKSGRLASKSAPGSLLASAK